MFVNKEFLFVFSNIAYFHHCLCNVQTCGALWSLMKYILNSTRQLGSAHVARAEKPTALPSLKLIDGT